MPEYKAGRADLLCADFCNCLTMPSDYFIISKNTQNGEMGLFVLNTEKKKVRYDKKYDGVWQM